MDTMFGSFLPPDVCGRVVCYLCLFEYSGVRHILCFCFVLFLRLLCPMLLVSLDCLFLIAPSVFCKYCLLINRENGKAKYSTHIHECCGSWPGRHSSINSGGVKLVSFAQISAQMLYILGLQVVIIFYLSI